MNQIFTLEVKLQDTQSSFIHKKFDKNQRMWQTPQKVKIYFFVAHIHMLIGRDDTQDPFYENWRTGVLPTGFYWVIGYVNSSFSSSSKTIFYELPHLRFLP